MSAIGVDEQTLAIGVLLVRLVTGIVMAAHGAQKLFGWFGGYGLNKTGEFFVQLGFWPGRALAATASASEIVGGGGRVGQTLARILRHADSSIPHEEHAPSVTDCHAAQDLGTPTSRRARTRIGDAQPHVGRTCQ